MAMQQKRVVIPERDPKEEYWTVSPNGHPIKAEWGVMSRRQKLLQLEAEKRAEHVALFDPCGLSA